MSKGKLLVLSGPSGAGKSTVIRAVTEKKKDFYFSVSATTRQPRPGETPDVSYHFLSDAEFCRWVDEGKLLEWARYVNHCYGTPAEPVRAAMAAGRDVLLDIDVQGGLQVKANEPDAILLFLVPPSLAELERRLRSRGDTAPEDVEKRLERARAEYALAAQRYEFVVVNENGGVDKAAEEILAILAAQKCTIAERIGFLKES